MTEGRDLSDEGAVASEESLVDVAAQIEALKARIEEAKRTSGAIGQGVVPENGKPLAKAPRPAVERAPVGVGRSGRNVIVALVLVLLGVGAAVIFTADGPDGRVRTNTTVAVDPASPGAANPAVSPGPPAPAPAVPDIRPPPAAQAVPPAAEAPAADVRGTTVVVAAGESFWSIAERVVEARGGGSTAEVAGYWIELIEINHDRLVQAGNPDLIYVGQEFSLP